ncbi:MAG: repeat protein, partial [Planctomycetaceae bacterium]|nr:repeat protein [Planctomycetaceae bacterium]
FTDFDGDGWQDLFVINGNVQYDRPGSHYYQPPKLFRNLEGKRFVDESPRGGPYFQVPHAGRGGAVGDLNNDGAPDLVVVHQQERVAVLLNQHPPKHWIGLQLRGESSNPDAIGARIVHRFAGRELTRWVHGGGSYLSSNDLRVVMPADTDQPVSVTVRWPSGKTAVFANLSPGKYHDLVEGRDSSQ